jgi:hypothetical protein
MDKEKAFDTIVDHASPFITLSTVLDEKGLLLYQFHIHPQIEEDCFMELEDMSTDGNQIMLTPDDLREFGDRLHDFADAAEAIIDTYHENLAKNETNA